MKFDSTKNILINAAIIAVAGFIIYSLIAKPGGQSQKASGRQKAIATRNATGAGSAWAKSGAWANKPAGLFGTKSNY